MKKQKKWAVISCVISLACALALGTTAWFLVESYESQTPNDVLAYLFRFFFIMTPVMIFNALIAVVRLKVKENGEDAKQTGQG